MRTRNKTHTLESLLELVHKVGECWEWVGTLNNRGYGVLGYKGKQEKAHRVVYALATGRPIPEGKELDHLCDNRRCVNPDHLLPVTHEENMELGRARRTQCKAGHEWNDDNTYLATVKRKQGGTRTQRYCRQCRAQHQADLRNRRKGNTL